MVEYSKKLSEDFKFVRVDFYDVQGRLFFGEMTFTPMGGYMTSIEPKMLEEMGQLVNIHS
jgi:hypothetical protein